MEVEIPGEKPTFVQTQQEVAILEINQQSGIKR